MCGIDLDKEITFLYSSMRYFAENEYHVTRRSKYDVLLLVFEGVLRFTEDGVPYEIHSGEYMIQKCGLFQSAVSASDAPKYLYVHFNSHWGEGETTLCRRGNFDYARLKPLMEELDRLSHTGGLFIEKTSVFYEILTELNRSEREKSLAEKIEEYIKNTPLDEISLEKICSEFHFSKNHIINAFKKEFKVTPVKYINEIKILRSEYLLEVTSDSLEEIARASGYNDYAYFWRLFARKNKMPPGEWRKKSRERSN